jgi:aryl sulfotransferase
MNQPANSKAPSAGPPWIDRSIQQQVKWRDGDIVISVPAKSGTTWTMNIVYQLLVGGHADFHGIYAEVPWLELVTYPGQPANEILDRVEAMPKNRRRAFKTHSAPPALPFLKKGSGKDVKYIVVCRNPEEAACSFRPFIGQHTDEWFKLWGVPREALYRDDFPAFYKDIIDPRQMQGMFFGFLAAWWSLRREPNVLLLHYSEMVRDHEGSIRKIAAFLNIEPTATQWPAILKYTSFTWMKQHESKFEAGTGSKVPILMSGAMMRKGQVGQAKADGMTDEIARHFREVGGRIFPNEAAINWFYDGGKLP